MLAHDPYGERRKPDWTGRLTAEEVEALLGAQGERVSRGFTGHEHLDRTGLIHMNGRMYDPRLGRFLSPDPIVGDPTSSQSWNLYSYVGNNPLSYVDPTGLVQAGPCDALNSGCMHLGGGGWSTRSQNVTITEIVYGVVSILSRREYVRGWDPVLNEPVWDLTYDSFWDLIQVALPFVATRIVTVTVPDQSVADEPMNSADVKESTVDKVLEAIKKETGILLEDILGDALEHAKEGTLEKIRARGDVILSDIEISNDQAVVIGSFENAGSEEIKIPQNPGVMILEPTIRGTFQVSEDQLKLKDIEGILGGITRGWAKPIDTITVPRHGDVQHTTRKR